MEQGLWSAAPQQHTSDTPLQHANTCRAGSKRSNAVKMAAAGAACQRVVGHP